MKTSKNKSIKITIPEPCHENWTKMTPTEKGKLCEVCTKEVIDFSAQSDEHIIKQLEKNNTLCGRFSKSQLNRGLKLERKKGFYLAPYAASLLVPFTLLSNNIQASSSKKYNTYTSLGISSLHLKDKKMIMNSEGKLNPHVKTTYNKAENIVLENKTKHTVINKNTIALANNEITISGTVNDNTGLPLPGVYVLVKGTMDGTQTDFDGNYTINAPVGSILIFSYVGFEDKEVTISNTNNSIDIELHQDEILMGEMIVCYFPQDISDEILGYKKTTPIHNPERDAWSSKIKLAAKNTWAYKKIKAARKKEDRKLKRKVRGK